jgi:hypothetical protein
MSDTNNPANTPAAEDTSESNDYDATVEHFGKEGFETVEDSENPEVIEEETPEGIPSSDTLKVNGKNITKPYSEIKEMAQKYEATSMKLETAKKEITEARAMKQQLGSQQEAVKNLLGVMQRGEIDTMVDFITEHLGGADVFNQRLVQYAIKLGEQARMSPEQREAIANKKLIQKFKADSEAREKADKEKSWNYEVNQWSQHINIEIPKAIRTVGLPDTEFTRESIISAWRAAIERGQQPTAAAVASFVKGRLEASKLLGQQPKPVPIPQRPTATRESVGLKKVNGKDETGYSSWDEWVKNRGR